MKEVFRPVLPETIIAVHHITGSIPKYVSSRDHADLIQINRLYEGLMSGERTQYSLMF